MKTEKFPLWLFEFQILDFLLFPFSCLFWSFMADQNTRGRWWTMKMEKFPFCPLNSPPADKELSLPCLRPNWITMFNRQLISLKTSLFPIGRFPTRGKRRSGRTSFILGGEVGDLGKNHFNLEINGIFSCRKKWMSYPQLCLNSWFLILPLISGSPEILGIPNSTWGQWDSGGGRKRRQTSAIGGPVWKNKKNWNKQARWRINKST